MLKKLLIALVSISIILFISVYFYSQSKMPRRSGELNLNGLADKVQVKYDSYGVPHIKAKTDADLYRAFGFIHAQDRLFQMEMSRRLSQGKLAEILGEELVGVDKLFRTLGLGAHAIKWVEAVKHRADPQLIELMQNYLAGVNEFVSTGASPVEFDLLGIPPHKYQLEDIASIAGFMAFSFAQGIRDDAIVSYLAQKLSREHMDDLGILYTPGFEQIPVNPQVAEEIASDLSAKIMSLQSSGLFHGSNSWLISPKRSQSGKAMLVNDPHIAFSQPAVWYEAQLTSPTTSVYGHFLGLIPLPMLGMTQTHAWGLTMFENDDMDLYAEKINPQNSNEYWAIDQWKTFETRNEIIKVKDQSDVEFDVKVTRHGPVINNIFDGIKDAQYAVGEMTQPIALWWQFLDTNNQMMEAFFNLPKADTVEKAAKAAEMIHAPGLNLMYANAKDDIAWWASAKLPIRPQHVNSKYILDGASGKDDILGFYDFKLNPQNINPDSGVLYSANNQTADMGNGLVPGYYSPTDRPIRIMKWLNSKEKFTTDDMKKMLMDNTTPSAALFQKVALPVLKKEKLSTTESAALESFSKWQGNHSPNETGAAIYNRFRINLMQLTMEDEIGKKLYSDFQFGFLMDRSIWRILENESSVWWDNVTTESKETRNDLIIQAWKESTAFLQMRFGDDVSQWTWEADIKMVHEHPLGKVKPLNKLFNVGPLPSEAGQEAINNLMFKQQGDDLKVLMGPSTRRVIDFADIKNSWGINPTGQSGVVFDEHYDDQAVDYSQGKFRHHWITDAQVDDNVEGVLTLVP